MEYHLANISLDGLLTHGFVLPEGYTWDLKLKNGMKEGKVVVKNQFNVVVAKLEYHNDKLNGLCLFYNNGVLSNKIMFVNDVANGRGCDVEKMKEVRWYLYENGKKKVELMKFEDLNGYWKEMDINTNSIISISHFDENNNKNGRCYLFDRDHISKVIDFLDNQPYRVVKEMKDDYMNEYNDQGDIIYQGQYEDSIKTDYPRLGQGSEMLHKECVYIGEWKDNKKNGNGTSLRDGETYYSGMWKNDLPDGEGFLCDENGELLYQGKWKNGFIKINEKEYFDYRKGKVVDKKDIINGENIKPGDVLIGMASSGVHSNGFSLVRSVFEMTKESLDTYYDELGKTLGEALIAPTKIYVKALKNIKKQGVTIKGCSHITGGGFFENVPRMLPDGVKAVIKKDSYEVPAIFKLIQKNGNIEEKMMYNTFNMGLGMIIAVDQADVEKTMAAIKEAGEECYVVGSIEAGEKVAELC